MDENRVLAHLRGHRDAYFSGEEISKKLGVSRAAVWKSIQALRKLGYEIEAQPHLGYRLAVIPDRLFPDEIAHGLGTELVGRSVLSFEELDSTNDALFRMADRGVSEGTCVFAEHQTRGKGRQGRRWSAPKGKNLLFSTLLKPAMVPAELPRITLCAAVSLVRLLRRRTGKAVGIKWPNDVFFGHRKLAGILTEMSAESDRIRFVILGIGVNLNSDPKDLPEGAESVRRLEGRSVNRIEFTQELLRELDADYRRLRSGAFDALAKDWEDYSLTSGRRVAVMLTGRRLEGQALGIDRDGALWIRKDDGLQERVLSGDVEHLRGKDS